MKILTAAVFVAWAMLIVSGEEKVKIDPEPVPTAPAPPTTTKSPETTTKSPETTTTTAKTTTTTAKTTTTSTPAPDTTTTAPNTTTTAPVTTPAPPPTPVPAPKPGKWIVSTNGTNSTVCIVLRMAAQFNVSYVNADNKTVYQLINLPSDNSTNASGDCGDKNQTISINWRPEGADSNDSVALHFMMNETKSYSLHHIEVSITPKQLPKINTNETLMMNHTVSEYKTAIGNSYRCMRAQELKMISDVVGASGTAKIAELQFQAFRTDKSQSFGYAEDCTFETQDVVPIVVGCALIALVIIVLAAYLIGRRRSQARGYVSM